MKNNILIVFLVFWFNYCYTQTNIKESTGESSVHKKSDLANVLDEAILNAQKNAVLASGAYINLLNTHESENRTISNKGISKKHYKTSSNYSSNDKILLRNSISAIVKNIDIKIDTIWLSKKKYKIRVKGRFNVDLKDMGKYIADYLLKNDKKIKIEVTENDCFGQLYIPLSTYINSKKNNFFFSSQPWLLGEGDFRIEINSNNAVLYDKRMIPNVTLKIYTYKNCQTLTPIMNEPNKLLDEIIDDIYFVYIYKSLE